MQRDFLDIIWCPSCHGLFTLKVDKETDGDILEGSLTCQGCGHLYPIEDGIPSLLPPETVEEPGG